MLEILLRKQKKFRTLKILLIISLLLLIAGLALFLT